MNPLDGQGVRNEVLAGVWAFRVFVRPRVFSSNIGVWGDIEASQDLVKAQGSQATWNASPLAKG